MLVHLDDDVDVVFVEQLSLDEARAVLTHLLAQVDAVREHIECMEEDEAQDRAADAAAERARELFEDAACEQLGGAA